MDTDINENELLPLKQVKQKQKQKYNILDNDYISILFNKISTNISYESKLEKIEGDLDKIPKFNEYNILLKYNYGIKHLKQIAKEYKLKIIGNKVQIFARIYSYLYLSNLIIKIQKIVRGNFQRKYNTIQGPGFKNREICTNNFDFLSMDELTNIPNEQFFSFKDDESFVYGFDALSLYNLIYKCDGVVKNPFNNKPLDTKVIETFKSFVRISNILNINLLTEISDVTKEVSEKKSVELRALTLFQNIDALGNYSDPQWFMSLNHEQLLKFIREVIDIWHYRAPLTGETKRAICPPFGNPFSRFPNFLVLHTSENIDYVRNVILDVLEKMSNTGIDKDSKCLGAYYVLGAITLVNNDAATALPWLYQAVCYI